MAEILFDDNDQIHKCEAVLIAVGCRVVDCIGHENAIHLIIWNGTGGGDDTKLEENNKNKWTWGPTISFRSPYSVYRYSFNSVKWNYDIRWWWTIIWNYIQHFDIRYDYNTMKKIDSIIWISEKID